MYLFFMALGLDNFDGGNPLLRLLEGVGLENLNFLGPKWHLLCSLTFQGPKKSQYSGPIPSNGPQNGFGRIKIISSGGI
jgi:hypothetical protein